MLQQSKVNSSSLVDGEALLSRYPVVETANFDYRSQDIVAQVVRLDIAGRLVDVYVTHLYRSRGEDALRLYQASNCWPGCGAAMMWKHASPAVILTQL